MDDCVFCKISNGKIPADKIYENNDFLAFLDINPVNPGHVLVIPKKHYRWVWDVPNAGQLFEVARLVAKALQRAMNTEYIACGIAGNDVLHAHIHLVPRFENDDHGGWIKPDKARKMPSEELKKIADKIRESF
jgi:histidine triad (HIT) family protein